MQNEKNRVAVIAIIITIVVIAVSVITWFATIKSQTSTSIQQSATDQSVTAMQAQPTASIPATQVLANDKASSTNSETFNRDNLEKAVFSAVDSALKIRYNATKDSGYLTWDKKVDITGIDVSQKAAEGKWLAGDAWDWIAWQQTNGSWKVLVSLDGFNCSDLDSVPSQYVNFFKDIIYQFGEKKYCYQW